MKQGGESNEFKVWVINTLNGQSLMILLMILKEWISGQDFEINLQLQTLTYFKQYNLLWQENTQV